MAREDVNITKVCRTCLSFDNTMTSIFNVDKMFKLPSYMEMLISCTQLKIIENDGLPSQICSSCISQIRNAYIYIRECKRTDTILHERIKKLTARSNKRCLPNTGSNEYIESIKVEHLGNSNGECNYTILSKEIKIEQQDLDVAENVITTKMYSCVQCRNFFLSQKDLDAHDLMHSKPDKMSHRSCIKSHKHGPHSTAIERSPDIIFFCGYCDKIFSNKIDVQNHITVHGAYCINENAISNIECEVEILPQKVDANLLDNIPCGDDFQEYEKGRESQLSKNHKVIVRKNKLKIFVCEICNKNFRFSSHLRMHILRHDPEKSFHCPLSTCRKSFASEKDLVLHVNVNHTAGKCPFCEKIFKHKTSLRTHLLIHRDEKRFTCRYCPKAFNYSHHLQDHERTHTKETPYLCNECGKGFAVKQDLKVHMSRHNNELPYKCTLCKEAFATRCKMRNHRQTHGDYRSHMCSHCGKTFPSKVKLTTHLQNAHNADEDGKVGSYKHKCGVCRTETIFENASALMEHMKTHTLQHLCEICDKGFALTSALEKHIKTHSAGDRSHICRECSAGFNRPENLRSHVLRVHSNLRPHKCDICQQRFGRNSDLNAHMRRHTGEKPYTCQICKRGFTQSNTLTAHMRTHTGEKPYICTICNKGYCTSGQLTQHMRSHNKS